MFTRSNECDSAHEWASLELDGELSSFEQVRLRAHLDACPDCVAFREDIASVTATLRASALVAPDRLVAVPRRSRSRIARARFTAVAAAAAVVVGAFGLASSVSKTSDGRSPFQGKPVNVELRTKEMQANQGRRQMEQVEQRILEQQPNYRPLGEMIR
jgi:predicted anti-sigma-YlaC factor YlaD